MKDSTNRSIGLLAIINFECFGGILECPFLSEKLTTPKERSCGLCMAGSQLVVLAPSDPSGSVLSDLCRLNFFSLAKTLQPSTCLVLM